MTAPIRSMSDHVSATPEGPKELDTATAVKLGEALFNFIARANDESEMDDFTLEDAGVNIASGFIEIDPDTMWTLNVLLDPEATS